MDYVELTAFVDESGTHDSNLTVMAGFVGYAERWAEFEAKWKLMLFRHGLPYIHAIDLRHGRKAFKDMIKWPPPRRLAVAQEAGRLVEAYALFSLSVFLKRADYDALYIGGDKSLRKHRAAIDSKCGVCARVFIASPRPSFALSPVSASTIRPIPLPGTVIEMAEATPVRMRIFDQVREAALNWDGRDPIRINWPQGK